MNGGGGDDTITGTAGLAPLIKLRMNGGEGNDTLIGSDGDDVMDAGPSDDTMVCGAGHDVMAGNDGDDRMVWNHGDESDVMVRLHRSLAQRRGLRLAHSHRSLTFQTQPGRASSRARLEESIRRRLNCLRCPLTHIPSR
jgi:hypothetical protein